MQLDSNFPNSFIYELLLRIAVDHNYLTINFENYLIEAETKAKSNLESLL